MDRTHTINFSAGGGNVGSTDTNWVETAEFHEFYCDCNIPIIYNNVLATGVISTIRSNNIMMIFVSDLDAQFDFTSIMRFRYTDL